MSADYLDVAHGIGVEIARTAIWHGDRCNWLGADWCGGGNGEPAPVALAALGPDLYGGTSGIAFFLAELYVATGEPAVRRAALGAMRQALQRVNDGRVTTGPGLYDGGLGVALAAARVGARLRQEWLVERAASLVGDPGGGPSGVDGGFDLISGRAGGIVGWLALAELLGDEALVKRAEVLAGELLAMAETRAGRYAWAPPRAIASRPLTGLSHGAAGVGYALRELGHRCGDTGYRRAADRAFAYERSLFDANERNWPDLRRQPGAGRRLEGPSFATLWCHGAPGIALSRLRGYQLDRDATCRAEAVDGIATTRRVVEASLAARRGNYSLCHGLAGNAEVLLHGAEILGPDWAPDRALALRVADAGSEQYATTGRSWSCGVPGSTPCLLLGIAGIGLFYLRLHDPAVPSVLLPRPESFGCLDSTTLPEIG